VKICGLTNPADLAWVCKCEADFAGMLIGIPQSSRNNTLQHAIQMSEQSTIPVIAVTMDLSEEQLLDIASELNPYAIQLHGNESPRIVEALKSQTDCKVWKVIHLPAKDADQPFSMDQVLERMKEYQSAEADAFLIDSMITIKGETHFGGTGKTSDWDTVAQIREQSPLPIILAGGINPQNITEAIRTVKPYAVDVSSGVERSKGKKDPDKVQDLIMKVRQMDTETKRTT
jgi:phosphoribosylanthranilate isomerase